ncbi:MAG: hypothetical protein FWD44_06785 [Oscillospiraceae bacterium]|nr:hypothetical protein [Oscillospiraceae bacterium]
MSKKALIIILCVALAICIAAVSIYFVMDYQKKQEQQAAQEQYISEVLQYIDNKYSSFNTADNKAGKIVLFNELSAYQAEFESGSFVSFEISSKFDNVLGSMTDSFYDTYMSMIDDVSVLAASNLSERQQYIINILADTYDLYERFNEVEMHDIIDGEVCDCEYFGLAGKALLYHELIDVHIWFVDDTFINECIIVTSSYIEELNGIKSIIDTDGVITDTTKLQVLYGKIDGLIEAYSEELLGSDFDDTLLSIGSTLENKKLWFFNYYTSVVDEIEKRELENDDDLDTLTGKILDLEELLRQIEEDNVLDVNFDEEADTDGDADEEADLNEDELLVKRIKDLSKEYIEAYNEIAARVRPQGGSGGSGGGSSGGWSGGGSSGGGWVDTRPTAPAPRAMFKCPSWRAYNFGWFSSPCSNPNHTRGMEIWYCAVTSGVGDPIRYLPCSLCPNCHTASDGRLVGACITVDYRSWDELPEEGKAAFGYEPPFG